MKQTILPQQNQASLKGAFQQKSVGLSLIIISIAAVYYVVKMWPMQPVALANEGIPDGYGLLVLTTVAQIILAQIVLQIVLVVGAGAAPAPTAHEKTAALKAKRNAYGVLVAGLLLTVGTVFVEALPPFYTSNLAILSLFVAEIIKFTSQVIYGRR